MKNKEISLLMSHGRAYNSGSFLLKTLNISHILDQNIKKEALSLKKSKRIAYLASKKVFNTAVLRNKAKRRLKNALLSASALISGGLSIQKSLNHENILIISAKKSVLTVDFKILVDEFSEVLKKAL